MCKYKCTFSAIFIKKTATSVSVETGVSGIETGFIALVGLNRERVINPQTKIYIPQILYHRGNIAYRHGRNRILLRSDRGDGD